VSDFGALAALVADERRLTDWRKCVFTSDGVKATASPVQLKRGPAVKVVRAQGAKDQTSTVRAADWPARAQELLENASRVHLLAVDGDWHARRGKRGRWLVSRGKRSAPVPEELPPHDRARRHPLAPEDPDALRLLVATGLFSPEGRLRKQQAAKFRQVQHYLELLKPLPVWRKGSSVRVVDAGCGKAYMSLGLAAWARAQGFEVELVGVDANPEVISTVAAIADELGYSASFEAISIWNYGRDHEGEGADLLVSLHACDTATDESLAAGVVLGADAIVLAPCCHHELDSQLDAREEWTAPMLRHGVLRGRFADLLTDSLRALVLEAFGYRAEVIEFVAAEHTAKNVMIRAVRRPPGRAAERACAEGLDAYDRLAARWGVEPTVRRLLADRWPRVGPRPDDGRGV
jgi:SAM-dependent methyltransferase